jgi:hypothetical protein
MASPQYLSVAATVASSGAAVSALTLVCGASDPSTGYAHVLAVLDSACNDVLLRGADTDNDVVVGTTDAAALLTEGGLTLRVTADMATFLAAEGDSSAEARLCMSNGGGGALVPTLVTAAATYELAVAMSGLGSNPCVGSSSASGSGTCTWGVGGSGSASGSGDPVTTWRASNMTDALSDGVFVALSATTWSTAFRSAFGDAAACGTVTTACVHDCPAVAYGDADFAVTSVVVDPATWPLAFTQLAFPIAPWAGGASPVQVAFGDNVEQRLAVQVPTQTSGYARFLLQRNGNDLAIVLEATQENGGGTSVLYNSATDGNLGRATFFSPDGSGGSGTVATTQLYANIAAATEAGALDACDDGGSSGAWELTFAGDLASVVVPNGAVTDVVVQNTPALAVGGGGASNPAAFAALWVDPGPWPVDFVSYSVDLSPWAGQTLSLAVCDSSADVPRTLCALQFPLAGGQAGWTHVVLQRSGDDLVVAGTDDSTSTVLYDSASDAALGRRAFFPYGRRDWQSGTWSGDGTGWETGTWLGGSYSGTHDCGGTATGSHAGWWHRPHGHHHQVAAQDATSAWVTVLVLAAVVMAVTAVVVARRKQGQTE